MSSTVLIVDDSAAVRADLAATVRALKLEPVFADSGEAALELFAAAPPWLVLLDVSRPGIDGYETARRMRAEETQTRTPIVFLSTGGEDQDLERAIGAGGDDYLVKPVSRAVLTARIRALQRMEKLQQKIAELSDALAAANQRAEIVSHQDALTGIANRRAFDGRLVLHFADAARRDEPLSVALCDVDHLGAYNDRYGRAAGDECLRKVAAALAKSCRRATDLVARYGAEEFAVLLPDTPAAGARVVLETARSELATLAIPHEASPTLAKVTFSAGVATYDSLRDRHARALVGRADQALGRAKQSGRNRVAGDEAAPDEG